MVGEKSVVDMATQDNIHVHLMFISQVPANSLKRLASLNLFGVENNHTKIGSWLSKE